MFVILGEMDEICLKNQALKGLSAGLVSDSGVIRWWRCDPAMDETLSTPRSLVHFTVIWAGVIRCVLPPSSRRQKPVDAAARRPWILPY